MSLIRSVFLAVFVLVALLPAQAQSPESYRGMLTARVRAGKLPPPQHLMRLRTRWQAHSRSSGRDPADPGKQQQRLD